MSDIVRAFPWVARLRPFNRFLEPALGCLIFLLVVPSLTTYGAGTVFIAFLGSAAVGMSRLVPWASLGILVALGLAYLANGGYGSIPVVFLDITLTVGVVAARRRRVERWFALGIAIVAALGFSLRGGVWVVAPLALFVGAWGIGTAIAEAADRIRVSRLADDLGEQLGASHLELAVTAERERVAQEVHDVVAHSLAVILAQAEGARALSEKRPAAMADALESIAQAARSALLDVRGIVDGLTGGVEPPQPTVDDLPELLHGVEESGVRVRSTSAGERRELGAAQQAAVYRIVQEGATNAIRHRGRGSALDVVLDWRGPGLSIQIVSSGSGDAVPTPGAGRGIPGMTDRARIAGGWLAAGEDESGDHRITAFVPFRETDPAATTVEVSSAPVPA